MNILMIGVDIAKQKFDAAFSLDGKAWHHRVFNNTLKGFESFLSWIQKHKIDSCHMVMEATGRYGENLPEYCYGKGYKVSVLNPVQIRYYAKSCLTRSKTDKVDSKLIAEFASKNEVTLCHPLSQQKKKLRALERCLEAFKRDRVQLLNRLESEKDPEVRRSLEQRVSFIDQQIKSLERSLKALAKATDSIKQSVTLLKSIPAIGLATAFSLLGELPDLSTFKCAKQLSAYAGLNPSIRLSGSSVKGRSSLSKMSSRLLRKLLYFPAMTAMRKNPLLRDFAQRLKEKGKKPMVVIAAVMRKLLHIVFGVLKKQQPFHA